MTMDLLNAACARLGKRLNAERVFPQHSENGWCVAAKWKDGRKRSFMACWQQPDELSSEQIDAAVAAAIDKLAEWRGANA